MADTWCVECFFFNQGALAVVHHVFKTSLSTPWSVVVDSAERPSFEVR
jgi:hypothetical protein